MSAPWDPASDARILAALGELRSSGLAELADFLRSVVEALRPLWFETSGSDCMKPLRVPPALIDALDKNRLALGTAPRHLSLLPIVHEDRTSKPPSEIEITDEMIDAGLAAYGEYDSRFMRDSSLVISIFEAMIRAAAMSKQKDHPSHGL